MALSIPSSKNIEAHATIQIGIYMLLDIGAHSLHDLLLPLGLAGSGETYREPPPTLPLLHELMQQTDRGQREYLVITNIPLYARNRICDHRDNTMNNVKFYLRYT